MAETKVEVTFKSDKGAVKLPDLKNHIELVESILDATATAPIDVEVTLDTDYDDDTRILVATWSV